MNYYPYDGHLCSVCGDRYANTFSGICDICRRQEQIDNDTEPVIPAFSNYVYPSELPEETIDPNRISPFEPINIWVITSHKDTTK